MQEERNKQQKRVGKTQLSNWYLHTLSFALLFLLTFVFTSCIDKPFCLFLCTFVRHLCVVLPILCSVKSNHYRNFGWGGSHYTKGCSAHSEIPCAIRRNRHAPPVYCWLYVLMIPLFWAPSIMTLRSLSILFRVFVILHCFMYLYVHCI